MKKILLPILLFVMFIPFEVGAKEYCKVVDGDGKSIGSEIACGSEHFYIIDSNEDKIKMLAKYNLYTGVTIYKEKLEEGQTCAELASSNCPMAFAKLSAFCSPKKRPVLFSTTVSLAPPLP